MPDTPPCHGLCDQASYENVRESLSALRDLFQAACMELDDREPLAGERQLVDDTERAVEALIRVQNTIEKHAVEELVWHRTRIPRSPLLASEDDTA